MQCQPLGAELIKCISDQFQTEQWSQGDTGIDSLRYCWSEFPPQFKSLQPFHFVSSLLCDINWDLWVPLQPDVCCQIQDLQLWLSGIQRSQWVIVTGSLSIYLSCYIIPNRQVTNKMYMNEWRSFCVKCVEQLQKEFYFLTFHHLWSPVSRSSVVGAPSSCSFSHVFEGLLLISRLSRSVWLCLPWAAASLCWWCWSSPQWTSGGTMRTESQRTTAAATAGEMLCDNFE